MTKQFVPAVNRVRQTMRALVAALALVAGLPVRADEPYARSRDYDLQHSKIALRFDLEQKKVLGECNKRWIRCGNSRMSYLYRQNMKDPQPH